MKFSSIFMGSWWESQDLSVGKNFTKNIRARNPRIVHFMVTGTETVNVEVGEFETYVVQISLENQTFEVNVDKDSGIFIKGSASDGAGIELAKMESF